MAKTSTLVVINLAVLVLGAWLLGEQYGGFSEQHQVTCDRSRGSRQMWGVTQLLWGSRPLGPVLSQVSRSFSLGRCSLRRDCVPKPKNTDRWDNKRSLFGVYDNIGILGDFKAHPKHLIVGPSWLRGWKGNELQRCIRKKMMIGSRMFFKERHDLDKRISFLYRRFNRYGKHR